MSEKYKSYSDGIFFVTLTVVDWIDIFTRQEYKDEIVKSQNYCVEHKGLCVYSWVIMSNHINMIVEAERLLGPLIRDFKSYTSKNMLKAIRENPKESRKDWLLYLFGYHGNRYGFNRNFQFWQDGFHPIALEGKNDRFKQKREYLHLNPVRARLVDEPHHYPWSSAHPLNPVKIVEV